MVALRTSCLTRAIKNRNLHLTAKALTPMATSGKMSGCLPVEGTMKNHNFRRRNRGSADRQPMPQTLRLLSSRTASRITRKTLARVLTRWTATSIPAMTQVASSFWQEQTARATMLAGTWIIMHLRRTGRQLTTRLELEVHLRRPYPKTRACWVQMHHNRSMFLSNSVSAVNMLKW